MDKWKEMKHWLSEKLQNEDDKGYNAYKIVFEQMKEFDQRYTKWVKDSNDAVEMWSVSEEEQKRYQEWIKKQRENSPPFYHYFDAMNNS